MFNKLYMFYFEMCFPIYRNNSDNAELVENAATLLIELAKYRKLGLI